MKRWFRINYGYYKNLVKCIYHEAHSKVIASKDGTDTCGNKDQVVNLGVNGISYYKNKNAILGGEQFERMI